MTKEEEKKIVGETIWRVFIGAIIGFVLSAGSIGAFWGRFTARVDSLENLPPIVERLATHAERTEVTIINIERRLNRLENARGN